jgi:hypothetical protein
MGNYVIAVGNYVIVSPSELGNYKIVDTNTRSGRGLSSAAVIDLAFAQVEPASGIRQHAVLIIRRSPGRRIAP